MVDEVLGPPNLTWSLEDLLSTLSKITSQDLVRFLKPTYPNEDLASWDEQDLLDLALSLMQTWEKQSDSPTKFLIKATSSLCRASFEAFVRMFWDEVPGSRPLLWNWHLRVMCESAQEASEAIFLGQRPDDLIINISPGSSKSSIFSRLLPCWIWTRMPEAGIITASHTEALVTDLAVHSREVMRRFMYTTLFPEIEFTETQDAKGHYRNTKGGERFTCTIGGKSPIGKHCNFALIDDALNPEDASSEAARAAANNFCTRWIVTRRQRGAFVDPFVRILAMQRIGMGDPTEAILDVAKIEGAAPVKVICIPAELTDDVSPKELRKYYKGHNIDGNCEAAGLFDPVRFSLPTLKEQRASLGEYVYASQFLQSPRPLSGGMFKVQWFNNRVRSAPLRGRRIRYWDRASSKSESACFTAGTLMCLHEDRLYVEDLVHGKWEPDERNSVMRATAIADRNRYGRWEPIIYVEAEGGSAGRDAWLGVVRSLMGFHVREDRVQGNKDTRAEPWATQLSAGNVFIVDNGEMEGFGKASWDIQSFIREHLAFKPEPTSGRLGRYKDIVDSCSGGFNLLVGRRRLCSPLQTIRLTNNKKNQGRWIISCSIEDLDLLDLGDQRALVVVFSNPETIQADQPIIVENTPKEVMCSNDGTRETPLKHGENSEQGVSTSSISGRQMCDLRSIDQGGGQSDTINSQSGGEYLPPEFPFNIGLLELQCADLDPADYQLNYGQPIQPWDKPIGDLQLSRDQAKKFWSHTLRKYDLPWQVLVIVDQGGEDRRALSAAMAVADMMRLPRSAIFIPSRDGEKETILEEDPPNVWVWETLKSMKNSVVV